MLLSSLAATSCSSWLMIWIFMEVNSLALCSYLSKELKTTNSMFSPSLMYLIIQLSASIILLFSINFSSSYPMFYMIAVCCLLLKSGVWPLHLWYMKVLHQLKMKSNSMKTIMTWQKLIPILLLLYFPWKITLMVTALASMVTPIKKLKTSSSMKSILILSSLNNNGWFILSTLCSSVVYLTYFTIYSTSLILSLDFLNSLKTKVSPASKTFYEAMILVGNMSGIPPLIMFLAKTYIIYCMLMTSTPKTILIVMMLTSCLFCYHYLWGTTLLLTNTPSKTQISKQEKSPTLLVVALMATSCMWVFILGFTLTDLSW